MRRKDRIPKILKKIQEEWEKHPDQRLGQLLVNYFHFPSRDPFFVEDDVFDVEVFQ